MTSPPTPLGGDSVRPEPGTRFDLITDAAARGVELTDRQVDSDTTKGLLASPERISLGKGHGQAPALYSSETRAVYRRILDHRAAAARDGSRTRDAKLALLVLHCWLYFGSAFVPPTQLNRAAKTAAGQARKSRADAERQARMLISVINVNGARPAAGAALRNELINQLNLGRPDPVQLRAKVTGVLSPRGLELVRGPNGAQLTVDAVVTGMHAKMLALKQIAGGTVTEPMWTQAHAEYAQSWPGYEAARTKLAEQAGTDLEGVFRDERGPTASPDLALDTILLLLGLPLLQALRPR